MEKYCRDFIKCREFRRKGNSAAHCWVWNAEEGECDKIITLEELKNHLKIHGRAPSTSSTIGRRTIINFNLSPYEYLNYLAIEKGIDLKEWINEPDKR